MRKINFASFLVLLAAIGLGYWFYTFSRQPVVNFRAKTTTAPLLVRTYNGPPVSFPNGLLSPETIQGEYWNGVGMKQSFVKNLPSGKTIERDCFITGWVGLNTLPEGVRESNPARRKAVEAAIGDCQEKLNWLNSRGEYTYRLLVVVDTTEGVGTPKGLPIRFLADEIKLSLLREMHKAGDTIELYGCKISGNRLTDCQNGRAGGSSEGQSFQPVEEVARWLVAPIPDSKETSFYEGLVNIFDWFVSRGIPIPETQIITDGIEHSPETTDFYRLYRRGGLVEGDFDNLRKQVFARRQFPDLKNVPITLTGPPRGRGSERKLIEASLAFGAKALRAAGANVIVRYQ